MSIIYRTSLETKNSQGRYCSNSEIPDIKIILMLHRISAHFNDFNTITLIYVRGPKYRLTYNSINIQAKRANVIYFTQNIGPKMT